MTARTLDGLMLVPRARRDLDDHVGRLHDADRLVADLQAQLVDGLGRHEADEPVRAGEDLDDGRDPVRLDPGDDAGEPVAGRLGDDRPIGRGLPPLAEQPRDLADLDEPLATSERTS